MRTGELVKKHNIRLPAKKNGFIDGRSVLRIRVMYCTYSNLVRCLSIIYGTQATDTARRAQCTRSPTNFATITNFERGYQMAVRYE